MSERWESERWDDAEAWQQARAARLREEVARLEGRDETAPNRPATAPVSDSGAVEALPPVRPSERLAAAHRRSVLSHDPPDAPNADEHPPHPVVDPPAAGDVWWRKRARYGR